MHDIDTTGLSDRNVRILKLYLDGYSHRDLAREVGMNEGSVANIISKFGMAKYRDRRTNAKLQRIANEHLEREERRRRGGTSVFGERPHGYSINFEPHPGQQEALDNIRLNFASDTPAAIVSIVCGRGWGKTSFLGSMLVEFMEANPNSQILWVAPYASTAFTVVDDFFRGINELTGARFVPDHDTDENKVWEYAATKQGSVLRWHNGAVVTFRTAENSEAIVSKGFHRVIVDEFCLIQDELVFKQKILGVARRPGCKIFLIGTPRGRNWGHDVFQKGLDPSETNYLSITQPYDRNPHFSKTLASLIRDLPEYLYRQEYLAEFIEDGSGVFNGLDPCVFGPTIDFQGTQQEWNPPVGNVSRRRFVVGLDLAKSIDFTVMLGMDLDTGECVYYRRMNRMDYKDVLEHATKVCADLNNATLVYDATGVGAGLSDFICQYGLEAEPYTFTNESKNALINKLALAIEHQEIAIPRIPTIIKELRTYNVEITKSGKITFNAPPGHHDDTVIALALANFFRDSDGGRMSDSAIDLFIDCNFPRKSQSIQEFMDSDND